MNRVDLIERSLRAFWLSLPGLVPVFGLPFAILAMRELLRCRAAASEWNPARRYLLAAWWCLALSVAPNLFVAFMMAGELLDR